MRYMVTKNLCMIPLQKSQKISVENEEQAFLRKSHKNRMNTKLNPESTMKDWHK